MHKPSTEDIRGEPLKQTELGPLPESWTVARLDQIATIERGKFAHRPRNAPQFYGGSIPFVQTGDVSKCDGRIRRYTQTLNERGLAISRMFPRGTILITIAANIGFTGILEFDSACTDSLVAITPIGSDNAEFLNFYLQTQRPIMDRLAPQGTQKNINIQFLKPWPIPLPPLAEQRQIAAVLSAVQRAVERQERLIALTAELKKALMHKLFTEGTRGEPLKQTEIGPVPESWSFVPLGEHLFAAQYGLSVKGADDGAIPILRMTNQVDGRIVANKLQMVNISESDLDKFKVEPGDVLFNRTNSFELVGRTAIFELAGDYVFASYLIRLRTHEDRLRPGFLNHYFNWDTAQARLKGIASRAVGQSNISASRLRGFLVPVPSLSEQDEIIHSIDQTDRVRTVRQREREVLQALFRTFLHQLMTAQVRVHDLDLSALEEADQPSGAG